MTTDWSVNAAGVQLTLGAVEDAATDLGTALEPIAVTLETLMTACDDMPSVPAEVEALLSRDLATLTATSERIAACILGASNATIAVVNSDEQMAADAQSEAVKAAGNGDLSFFGIEKTP